MDKIIKLIEETEEDLDDTINSLNDLVNNPQADLRKQAKAFNKSLGNFKKSSDKMGEVALTLQERASVYFPEWETQISAVEDRRMRRNFEKRREDLMKRFDRVIEHYQDLESDFAPLSSQLNDVYIALSTDLTPGGLRSIGSIVTQANRNADRLKRPLSELKKEFTELKREFTPTMDTAES